MYQDKKISVIIAAAGFGKRMGGSINKQYISISGMPVLARTTRCFALHSAVDEIILTVKEEDIASCRRDIVERYGLSKVKAVIAGGKERQDSVYQALKAIGRADYILIHDGARPFVTQEEINCVLDMALRHGAAAVGVPVKDTIKVTDEEGCILETPDRKTLYAVQTPQAFEAELIRQAFDHAYAEGFYGTDETVLLEKMGKKVYISKGSYTNIKITTPEDIMIGEAILRKRDADRKEMRTGIGYDVHAFAQGRDLVLGGVKVPYDKGLAGHSDADVLVHAVMDALLGACGLGDIGRHFPDTDEQYKGISSLTLLSLVKDMVQSKGFQVVNVDAVVVAQNPRLAPHIALMVENIARTLAIDPERVNVKATTTERLGFAGREEGIAAQAVAFVVKNE